MIAVNLNKKLERVEIKAFSLENKIVYNYFKKLPESERTDALIRAINIGVLALMEDRLSTFMAKTSNELGTELESLKMIFDMKNELFLKASHKGTEAEENILEFLNRYFEEKGIKDLATSTSTMEGNIPKNKTGDIVCKVDGKDDLKITIECKLDKTVQLGPIEDKNVFTRNTDTAWSQLIESDANRGSEVSIIVFDISLVTNSIYKSFDNVGYISGIGFVAIVDSQKGDYSNLAIAYRLARDIAVNDREVECDYTILEAIVKRIIKSIDEITCIKKLVNDNIKTSGKILAQIEKSYLLMSFNQRFLKKFLANGTLTKEELLNFYTGEEVKDNLKPIQADINNLIAEAQ